MDNCYLFMEYCSVYYKSFIHCCFYYTLKNAGPNFGSNMDKPSHWVQFLNYIFNPMFEFVHFCLKVEF